MRVEFPKPVDCPCLFSPFSMVGLVQRWSLKRSLKPNLCQYMFTKLQILGCIDKGLPPERGRGLRVTDQSHASPVVKENRHHEPHSAPIFHQNQSYVIRDTYRI